VILSSSDVLFPRFQIAYDKHALSFDKNFPPPRQKYCFALQTSSSLASTTIPGVDTSFKLDNFKQGLNIEVTKYENHDMEFEVKGISCAVRVSYFLLVGGGDFC
jgi:hypothetical protein